MMLTSCGPSRTGCGRMARARAEIAFADERKLPAMNQLDEILWEGDDQGHTCRLVRSINGTLEWYVGHEVQKRQPKALHNIKIRLKLASFWQKLVKLGYGNSWFGFNR